MTSPSAILPYSLLIKRALFERCPACGQAPLFSGYLKPVTECAHCHANYEGIRADDGPAWLTILIVCHIIVPSMIAVQIHHEWPAYWAIPFWLILTTGLTLWILPKAKTLFMGAIWRNRQGSRAKPN